MLLISLKQSLMFNSKILFIIYFTLPKMDIGQYILYLSAFYLSRVLILVLASNLVLVKSGSNQTVRLNRLSCCGNVTNHLNYGSSNLKTHFTQLTKSLLSYLEQLPVNTTTE